MDRMTDKTLTALAVEASERMDNARLRGDRRLAAFLGNVKAGISEIRERRAEEAAAIRERLAAAEDVPQPKFTPEEVENIERSARAAREALESARRTVDAFNGADWMGQGEKQGDPS